MPESVKISALPPLTSLAANDIVPVVDADGLQTSKVTASQIAALGGGPPGSGTVETIHLKNGAVTAPKVGFSAANKVIVAPTTGAGDGREIDCSPVMQGLLAQTTTAAARIYLDGMQTLVDPVFSGRVTIPRGSATAPSLISAGDADTGLFFPDQDALCIAHNGVEVFRLGADGYISTRQSPDTILRTHARVFAYVSFNGTTASGTAATITANHQTVSNRYGLTGSILGDDQTTRDYINWVESRRTPALAAVFDTTPFFQDSYGKQNPTPPDGTGTTKNQWAAFQRSTENRANYTTVDAGNFHWRWNGTVVPGATTQTGSWVQQFSVWNRPWIGTVRFDFTGTAQVISESLGVVSVRRVSEGRFEIVFTQALPSDLASKYVVFGICNNSTKTNGQCGVVQIVSTAADRCTIECRDTANVLHDPGIVHVLCAR